jgi:tetratricopeptide (TPR) repeat protein
VDAIIRRGPALARRAVLVVALAAALLAIAGVGVFVRVRPPEPSTAATGTAAGFGDLPLSSSATLSQAVAALQARLRAVPADWDALASLGSAYVQQARITADPTYYPKAEAALRRSLAMHPTGNVGALTGLGALALARHDFSGGLSWGRKAAAIDPYSSIAHGVMGDALVELGAYGEGFAELQRMVDLRPGLSSYARASYARELQGDVEGATGVMKLALAAAGAAQDRAWVDNQLGDLAFNAGQLDEAQRRYSLARAADPSFVPARAGLAKVAAARGHLADAIRRYRSVTATYPLPEYVIALADLYTVSGQQDAARQQFALLHVEERLFQANGVNMDLEIALVDADHGRDLAGGLAAAQAEWARRHSIHVADALGWALHAVGRNREALTYANSALRLGTKSASFLFHRAMIERALGERDAERRDLRVALDINPHFSILWSGRAAAILAHLERSS